MSVANLENQSHGWRSQAVMKLKMKGSIALLLVVAAAGKLNIIQEKGRRFRAWY